MLSTDLLAMRPVVLPLQAVQLLADMRALSAPNSKLIATCIDR